MADRYTFTGKDGVERTFIGDRPPTPDEMAGIEKSESKKPARTWTDTAVDSIPTVAGAAGGIIGGLGGTVAGMGVGGVPGAIGGAAVGGAGGEALRQLVNLFRGAPIPPTASERAGDIGKEGALQSLYELGGQGVSAGLSTVGRSVYRGYLKPSLSRATLQKAGEIVETGIREAIPVTEAGAAKASELIGSLRNEADRILANTTGDVDLHSVADKLRAWGKQIYNRPGRAPADYEAVLKVADRIDNHPSMIPKPPMAPVDRVSATVANQAKRDMQAGASTAYGLKSGAEKTSEKVGASMLREGVEAVAPEVGPINARESQLIELSRALNRATGREANRNQLFGVPALMAGTSGAAELAAGAGRFGAGAMALATRMGLTPAVATRAAILAAKMGDQLPGTAVADVARIAVRTASESQQ